eukprot:5975040-Prorocentrum_lima.AAC.1
MTSSLIRDDVESRGLGDVYKRQRHENAASCLDGGEREDWSCGWGNGTVSYTHLTLPTICSV